MDHEASRQFRELYWTGKQRRALLDDSDRVGLTSGGPHSVQLRLDELAALGIVGWSEPLQMGSSEPSRSNVYIRTADRPKLFGTDPTMTRAQHVAADLDAAEHAARCRAERSWVSLWWGDVAEAEFEEAVKGRMTREQAKILRDWVVEEGPTWRGIAKFAQAEFTREWRIDWTESGHQGVGIVIGQVAASMFGETVFDPPWN